MVQLKKNRIYYNNNINKFTHNVIYFSEIKNASHSDSEKFFFFLLKCCYFFLRFSLLLLIGSPSSLRSVLPWLLEAA